MCSNQSPWSVSDTLAYGFAARTIAGETGSSWCCACYELTFTSAPLVGKKLVVQTTNTGSDLSSNQFDLAVSSNLHTNPFSKTNSLTATDSGRRCWAIQRLHQRMGRPLPRLGPTIRRRFISLSMRWLPRSPKSRMLLLLRLDARSRQPRCDIQASCLPGSRHSEIRLRACKRCHQRGSNWTALAVYIYIRRSGVTAVVSDWSGAAAPTDAPADNGSGSDAGMAAQYAQCGGDGFTGPTVCVATYTGTVSSEYYSQCLWG